MIEEEREFFDSLDERFEELKEKYSIKASLDDIDKNFSVRDWFLESHFIGGDCLSRISFRMIEVISSIKGYLHELIMPSPANMFVMNESKVFDSDEKKNISKIMSRMCVITSARCILALKGSEREYAKFIDDVMKVWDGGMREQVLIVMKKINREWER